MRKPLRTWGRRRDVHMKQDLDDLIASLQSQVDEKARELAAVELYMEFLDALAAEMKMVPHCDSRLLHSPGTCVACDEFPTAQVFRKLVGLKFTDQMDENEAVLPGMDRTVGSATRWGGNRTMERKHGD